MNYYGGMAVFCYRTSFVAAALTYGIVVYKTQKALAKNGTQLSGGVVGLLRDENIQYLRTFPSGRSLGRLVLSCSLT